MICTTNFWSETIISNFTLVNFCTKILNYLIIAEVDESQAAEDFLNAEILMKCRIVTDKLTILHSSNIDNFTFGFN